MILLLIPALVLALASIAAFFGRFFWWLDVLANFRAQFLVALVILGLALLFSRYRRFGWGILLVAVINLIVVAPLYVGSPGESRIDAPTVRVMSFNLLSTNEQYGDVVDFIRLNEPDLVLLHESSLPWETAMRSADLGYEVVKTRAENLIFGTLVMVKSGAEVVSFGFAQTDPRAVEIEFVPEAWGVSLRVLSSHALAPTNADRAALRDAQLGFAADWASETEGPHMVVGDFNATPWSWPFRNLVAEGNLRNSQIGFGLQPTFAANSNALFRVPIDHLLHSDQLRVRQRNLGPPMGSDHFPIVVDLELVDG